MSSDSTDQWHQAVTGTFRVAHPIAHTWMLAVVATVWETPGAVALLQVIATTALLAFFAKRLVELGVNGLLAIGTVYVIALLPMTGAMTVSIWKDVPFSIALGWVAVELLLHAQNRQAFWSSRYGPIRLGVALGLVWAMRANGFLTAVPVLVALGIVFWTYRTSVAKLAGAAVAVGLVLPIILTVILDADGSRIEPAEVFMPGVGAVYISDRDALTADQVASIEAVADEATWVSLYRCYESTPLVFNDGYDSAVIKAQKGKYRGLVVSTFVASPLTVLGHRWCSAEYLFNPINRMDVYLHRPPYEIAANEDELVRDSISWKAWRVTLAGYQFAEREPWVEIMWRPALVILAGMATMVGVLLRRRLRPLWWVALLFGVHLANVTLTSPAPEFRYAYGLYLITLTSLPLWQLIVNPDRAKVDAAESAGVVGTPPGTVEQTQDADR
jgi:hypothetical protein